jgi:hypothetical protein
MLFPSTVDVDIGKVRLPLLPGTVGGATYAYGRRYRTVLLRSWNNHLPRNDYVLWIGMNPSTAEAAVDDRTIRKELYFTKKMGFRSYVKCNVMDYRSTDPRILLDVETPCSDQNLPAIIQHATNATVIVVCWGSLPKPLRRYADEVVQSLSSYQLYCMGKTKDGSPRHPLYLSNTTEKQPWP